MGKRKGRRTKARHAAATATITVAVPWEDWQYAPDEFSDGTIRGERFRTAGWSDEGMLFTMTETQAADLMLQGVALTPHAGWPA